MKNRRYCASPRWLRVLQHIASGEASWSSIGNSCFRNRCSRLSSATFSHHLQTLRRPWMRTRPQTSHHEHAQTCASTENRCSRQRSDTICRLTSLELSPTTYRGRGARQALARESEPSLNLPPRPHVGALSGCVVPCLCRTTF